MVFYYSINSAFKPWKEYLKIKKNPIKSVFTSCDKLITLQGATDDWSCTGTLLELRSHRKALLLNLGK